MRPESGRQATTTTTEQAPSFLDSIIEMSGSRIKEVAITASKSGLLKDMTADRAEMIMLIAQARGIHPIDALMQFDVIDTGQGLRLAMKSEAMLAYLQRDGWHTELLTDIDDDTRQTYRLTHPRLHPEPKEYTLTMARLDERGVSMRIDKKRSRWNDGAKCYDPLVLVHKETYAMHGAAMLRARLTSAFTRALRPGILNGVYTPEELRDVADDMTVEDIRPTPEARQASNADRLRAAVTPTVTATIIDATPTDTRPASTTRGTAPEIEVKPKQVETTKDTSTAPPTLLARARARFGKVSDLKAILLEAANAQDIDAVSALLDQTIARIADLPSEKSSSASAAAGMTAAWQVCAPDLHEGYPALSARLAKIGCPPPAPKVERAPAPIVEDDDDDIPFSSGVATTASAPAPETATQIVERIAGAWASDPADTRPKGDVYKAMTAPIKAVGGDIMQDALPRAAWEAAKTAKLAPDPRAAWAAYLAAKV